VISELLPSGSLRTLLTLTDINADTSGFWKPVMKLW